MVDSGQVHPETVGTVIDLTQHPDFRSAAPRPVASAPTGGFLLDMGFLMDRLDDRSDQVKMWAAYQLVERWETEAEQYLERMWSSPLPEIRESAIDLVAKHRIHHYAFPLLRVFNSDEGGLRAPAALALGHLAYQPAARPLEKWVRKVFSSPEADLPDLEAGIKALLLLDNRRYWEEFHTLLQECTQNHALFSVLFKALTQHARTAHQVERLTRVRTERDTAAVDIAVTAVKEAARSDANVMPAVIDAVERYATVGEICRALVEVYGRYEEPLRM